jgi:hypothetical protein
MQGHKGSDKSQQDPEANKMQLAPISSSYLQQPILHVDFLV